MNAIIENVVAKDNLNIHVIPTKKYKTVHIVAKFKAVLSRESITMRALLPYILRQGTENMPSEQEFQLKLDELYGAVLSIDGAKKGDHHIISFRLEVANQNYIENESTIIDEAITLLKEVIYHPRTSGNAFDPHVFEREKETLHQKIEAVIDDKMAYANMRLIDEMCKDEKYALHIHGYKEDLAELTVEHLYNYYLSLLKEDQLDIYVLGDFEEKVIIDKISSVFESDFTPELEKVEPVLLSNRDELQVIVEKQAIQQAKLHIGYRTNCTFKDEGYAALQVFNGLFGGFPSSKLFINVREKNSLAYYAASRLESHKGLLLVFSGIATEDYEKARDIIELQMTAMKNGEFTDAELSETKDLIVNQLLETLDHPQGIIELLYQQVIGNKQITPDELMKNILAVTKEDVINAAKGVTEDTVYLLTTKESEDDE